MEPFDPLAFAPGTLLAKPSNISTQYDEYAIRMALPDADQAWFVIHTKHGGAYTSGVELHNWTVAYNPPILFEE